MVSKVKQLLAAGTVFAAVTAGNAQAQENQVNIPLDGLNSSIVHDILNTICITQTNKPSNLSEFCASNDSIREVFSQSWDKCEAAHDVAWDAAEARHDEAWDTAEDQHDEAWNAAETRDERSAANTVRREARSEAFSIRREARSEAFSIRRECRSVAIKERSNQLNDAADNHLSGTRFILSM